MASWDPRFQNQLLEAADYRSFLRLFFLKEEKWSSPRPLSFGEFAERAGFKSKSFMNDVLARRKRLTPASLDNVVRGLKLNDTWAIYLRCLVGLEEKAFQFRPQDEFDFRERLSSLKLKIKKRGRARRMVSSPLVQIFLQPSFPEVYASLGTITEGETLQGIEKRSRIERKALLPILEDMQKAGLIRKDELSGRYLPIEEAFDAEELRTDVVFQQDFFRAVDRLKRRFDTQSRSKDSLFRTETFSVSSAALPRLREELAQWIRSFASDAESPQGDCIVEITLGLTHNRERS